MTLNRQIRSRVRGAVVCAVLGFLSSPATAVEKVYEVTGNRVNLRAAPSLESEIVGVASRGDRVIVRRIVGDWADVRPPQQVSFWVHSAFVQDDTVTAAQLNVRAGPDIRSASLGKIDRGKKVNVRTREDDWLEIAAPAGIAIWINRPFIAEPSAVHKEPPAKPVEASRGDSGRAAPMRATDASRKITNPVKKQPEPAVASTVQSGRSLKRPASTPASASEAKTPRGRAAQYEGIVQKAAWVLHRPSEYTLVSRQAGRAMTICYLTYDTPALESLVGRKVLVTGREYLVDGVRHSVLEASRIEEQSGRAR